MRAKKAASQSIQLRNDASFRWVRGMPTSGAPDSDKALAIFQPDILIPEQFRATCMRTLSLESEKLLMLAVLWDAIACFQGNLGANDNRKQQLFLEAERWISDSDPNYFFSFENICTELGFAPAYLRQGLMAWKEIALAERAAQRLASYWPEQEAEQNRPLNMMRDGSGV